MDNREKKGKRHQGTCIKDPWTKPKRDRFEGERGVSEAGGSGSGKMEKTVLEQQQKKRKCQ